MNAVPNSIAAMAPELVERRRDFHRHPELMYDLPRTAGIVARELRRFGFDEVVEGVARTGVLGILHGARGPAASRDKRVLFRADMDALPIQEAGGAAHASETPQDACLRPRRPYGHAAGGRAPPGRDARLRRHPRLLLPARGGGRRRGAGDDRRRHAGAVPGQGRLRRAQLAGDGGGRVRRGPRRRHGLGGRGVHHGPGHRRPRLRAAEGARPDRRRFSEAVSRTVEEELRRICEKTAEAFGATVRVHRPPLIPYPPTVNHEPETEIALSAMRAVAGEGKVRDGMRPAMASEDFAFVLRQVPGAYVFVGNGDTAALHNPAYDFNDEAIPYGVAYWAELARKVLPE